MDIHDIVNKARTREGFTREEIITMLSFPENSLETYIMMAEAKRFSMELCENQAEAQGQFALNLAPCPENCMFCSFAIPNGIFTESTMLTPEEAVFSAKKLEADNSTCIYMMATANIDMGEFLETAAEVRRNLKPETIMIGNIGDQDYDTANKIKETGFTGLYHALRMGEGTDTDIDPEQRKRSIKTFQEAGLVVGTCVEPIGPEHSNEEIADKILFAASVDPAFSGAARRISIPGTDLAKKGMISEMRMAQCVAVTRLATPSSVMGTCTHEPCTLGAAAGANLFWAEVGANPRDIKEKTEEGRGHDVEWCRTTFEEAGWSLRNGLSQFFNK
ncbi:radical SAM protein [Limisalsivibrio acetivorans]|uniref:radical SAM protein n=1 Tax=Limisalsivibrio acetivorans TaxID=1304888 RepID=UPI0003B6BA72|nr:radical SAM protein [Limisalsivibrio acetivorans]